MKRSAKIFASAVAALAASLLLLAAGSAQDGGALADVRVGVRQLGKRFNPEVLAGTGALYAKLQHSAEHGGVRVVADVKYGPDALQAFDLYVPERSTAAPAPIVVYLHGGGLVSGDKVSGGTDGLIYGNIGMFFARHGIIGVNANYRLVPNVKWPGGPEDIHAMLQWLRENAAQYGGDAGKIFLMGNSAGATHVAAYLFHQPTQLDGQPGVVGAILSSGGFAASGADTMRAYIGADEAAWKANSPLGLVDTYTGTPVPIFMWSAEYDPAFIETPVAQMYAKLCAKYQDCPRYTQWQGHNHVSHVMSLNSVDSAVGEAVLDFVHNVLADASGPAR
jgi:triacylglycerol lipase